MVAYVTVSLELKPQRGESRFAEPHLVLVRDISSYCHQEYIVGEENPGLHGVDIPL